MTKIESDQLASSHAEMSFSAQQGIFAQLTEPHRRQIRAYCYRMLGSLSGAEDVTQETFLKAWDAFDKFEGRGSFKGWLYQIATRLCLDTLRQGKRRSRILPEAEFPPATAMPEGPPLMDSVWLEPYPDTELDKVADDAPSPEARYETREAIRLAFVAAIQYLPPRQRAVLLLIDVLGWSPAETTTLVGGSVASINSALQRARSALSDRYPHGRPDRRFEVAHGQNILLDRYVRTWEAKDLDGFVALLKEDASYAMPPRQQWYLGRDAIRQFFSVVWRQYGCFRLLPTAANRQPAFVLYTRNDADKSWSIHSLHVLTVDELAISNLLMFMRPLAPGIGRAFGFPEVFN
jgi:RNA polymerase sigma-70 factor, ECF subfamily